MKAILVIDMPKTCSECPLSYFAYPDDFENDTMYCKVHEGYMEDAFNIRAVWCPLKPIPNFARREEYPDDWLTSATLRAYDQGWNSCVAALTLDTMHLKGKIKITEEE